ncbi:hypothetical protein MLD38_001337 [Melastoma candidum]|uniref:Uncharacterized protein n=1 Tax=Melastoma candidum TaxID=119954 RepID=A0ACB9SHU4_9MYRT|nr:hypothetical protein MLD38_001337 [Melastoma candidum]
MRSTVGSENKLGGRIDLDDKNRIDMALMKALKWLDDIARTADKDEFREDKGLFLRLLRRTAKFESTSTWEVEAFCGRIIGRVYDSPCGELDGVGIPEQPRRAIIVFQILSITLLRFVCYILFKLSKIWLLICAANPFRVHARSRY